MNILYGVCGEGYGHSSHAISIVKHLESKGHKVKIITYGQAYEILKDRFDVVEVSGLSAVYENGRIRYRKTVAHNFFNLSRDIFALKKINKIVREFKPDICISDMEFLVPVIAFLKKLPLISLSNQNILTCSQVDFPKKYYKDYILAKIVIKLIVPFSGHKVILSFCDIEKVNKKESTTVVSPIIREEIRKLKFNHNGKIVVYLSRDNSALINELKKINEKFIIYGYDINKIDGNLVFKKREHFLEDFRKCKAFISTSGFTSIGEAIYLKKPYLAVPLKRQFEQIYNAIILDKIGLGKFLENPSKEQIIDFIKNIEKYRKNFASYKPAVLMGWNNTEDNDYPHNVYSVLDKLIADLKK